MKPTKLVVIGGGTGSFTVLSALRDHISDITALVNMADDGGSTGVLRDELGVLPPGDARQCLVALSEAPQELRELFNYRFDEGSLKGHSFGNLFLSAVQKKTNNFGEAVRMASDILRIKGQVLPITLDNVRLAISWQDGTAVHGEGRIDIMHFVKDKGLPTLHLHPKGGLNPAARQALEEAQAIVIAPGDLYTSLGPLLIVEGVAEALMASRAAKIYISNLVEKPGQTSGFSVADHAAEIERFVGAPFIDYVLYNTATPDAQLFEKYAKEGELLVKTNQKQFVGKHYKAVGVPLIASDRAKTAIADPLAHHRSFIRHDANALLQGILGFL
ncbi:MAG TPA: gluconeogenesis factor YvcK family protein [Candidatus Saccharimonadales bacterium]